MELAPLQAVRHPVPPPRAGGGWRTTAGRRQHPGIHRMAAERWGIFPACRAQPVLLTQLLRDAARVARQRQPLLLEEAVEMGCADWHRTERLIPPPASAWPHGGAHLLGRHSAERQDLRKLLHDPRCGGPAAACRGWQTRGACQPMLAAAGPPPPTLPSRPPPPPRFDRLLDGGGRLEHAVADRVLRADHAVALEPGTVVDADHQPLLVGLLRRAELQ